MPSSVHSLDKYPRRFGKYHLLGPLAQGGMGALYLAVAGDRGLERLMVIKTVLPHLADAEYVARFRDEAKVVVKLSHGNLIPVFDAGQVDGELFLAMDFVEGRDLRAVWNRCAKKGVAFPVDIAVYIVKELCRGLAYAHSFPDLQLVHRDISPPNVLVSFTGEVKLTDFGLASSTLKLEKTAPGIIYGKVAYMSPEQARGEALDGRSDQYAAGIVLWELLTGRQLFPPGKEQPQDLLTRAKNPEVLRPSKRAPRVPPELDEIVLRSLAADRADRFPSCEELRQALQGWLAVNAPTVDATRMSDFIRDLFIEDIDGDRLEREAMVDNVRKRAMTLPPTHELRQLLERPVGHSVLDAGSAGATAIRQPGSIGRRSTDRGAETLDRRRQNDRRAERGSGDGERASSRSDDRAGDRFGDRSSGALAAAAAAEPASDSQPIVGQIVDGRYRVVELVGEGGMGKVYLAEHIDIGKRVALKVLHPSYSRMPDLVERFRREARAASKIGHPHIVDVTDSGTTAAGSAYFVMEYLEGVELGSVIEREDALDPARALRIAAQICRALAAAHAAGIIHRDLKPENIYLTHRDGNHDFVKVLDFGIAKTTEAEEARERRLTSPGMAMGTPEYMAPEQAAGRAADARCDVYALGAILYEMLTGLAPYQGDNFMEILTKKATLDPAPPIELRSTIPPAVSALVMQAMARNPDHRPPTMEAFEYELMKCLGGRGVAVAQVLGMAPDHHMVASLNPGLSGRVIDSGATLRPSPSMSSPGLTLPPASPASNPALATPAPALAPTQTAPTPRVPAAVPEARPSGSARSADDSLGDLETSLAVRKRSSAATVAWIALTLAVLTGLGVLLYVAAGERGRGRGEAASRGALPATANDADAAAVPSVAVDAGAAAMITTDAASATAIDRDPGPGPVPGSSGGSSAGSTAGSTGGSGTPGGPHDGGKPQVRPVGSGDPAGSGTGSGSAEAQGDDERAAKEAAAILASAERMARELNWAGAIEQYQRLIASKQLLRQAYFGLAKASWENGNVDATLDAATTALRFGGGVPARKLLGNAYFRKGDYQAARMHYERVLKDRPDDPEVPSSLDATLKKLGLPPHAR